ncbi:MAG TPA: DUF2007 domain-containing protein [Methylothermaceae bacterium]|nr:DUF2007 domain-containing protein [Methylothermaceae bacterium]
MQPVYSAENILEAHILKGYLEQYGLHVHISGYYLQGGIGELPVTGLVQLWVAGDEVDRARELLEAYQNA